VNESIFYHIRKKAIPDTEVRNGALVGASLCEPQHVY